MNENYEIYTPEQRKRAEVRENRLAALAYVGNAYQGRGDVSSHYLDRAYRWALEKLEEE